MRSCDISIWLTLRLTRATARKARSVSKYEPTAPISKSATAAQAEQKGYLVRHLVYVAERGGSLQDTNDLVGRSIANRLEHYAYRVAVHRGV